MAVWTLAKKELKLLLRDPRAAVILLGMPLILILILGLSLGEGFGQKPDDRLRVTLVDLDQGYTDAAPLVRQAAAWSLGGTPAVGSGIDPHFLAALCLANVNDLTRFPREPWSHVVRRDLEETASIRVEVLSSREEAQHLVDTGKRAAVLIFKPEFSERVAHCSFLTQSGNINPFYRDGVQLDEVGAELLRDPTQLAAASIIEQVAQVTLLRVILPWMIGRAFEKLGDPMFIDRLAEEVDLPVFGRRIRLKELLLLPEHKQAVGSGVQAALRSQFSNYELTGKTWATLTRSTPPTGRIGTAPHLVDEEGSGWLKRGAIRYQLLVPSYTVMFAFFLVLTVGWLFVSERRQGTLKRLLAAPLSKVEVLLGKTLPCFVVSLAQGIFLLLAGKLVFGMSWGPSDWPWWRQALLLLPVVVTTSLAAIGLALLIAALARTETQVAIYGTLLVLVLAGVSGCLMPRDLMPEQMRQISLVTPHAWALDAYSQLLTNPSPNLTIVWQACLVLTGFGTVLLTAAWSVLRLD
jgi:ABC-type multidrug transport system permease subunit